MRFIYYGNIRQAATRLALLDLNQAAAKVIASLPDSAFEPVEGRRGLVIDSVSEAWPPIPDIHVKAEPATKKRWPSSSRQRFGK